MKSTLLLAVCLGIALPGCAVEPPHELRRTQQAVIAGTPDDSTESAVFIVANAGTSEGYCSGVVVSPHVVLTAGHCTTAKASYRIFLGHEFDAAKATSADFIEVIRHVPHPRWNERKMENDIGVLVTATPIPRRSSVVRRTPLEEVELQTTLRIVGFGRTEATVPGSFGRRMQGTVVLAGYEPTILGYLGAPNFCIFDSGGPTFGRIGGEEVVVGVHSIASTDCTAQGLDTRVDAFTDFIDAEIAKADGESARADAGSAPETTPEASPQESAPPQAAATSGSCSFSPRSPDRSYALAGAGLVLALRMARKRSRRS